ncbi:MAG TPA: glutathionylspermidine synthase family protein [Prolixibacteraceae bacterium]|nr:glutathionylspermidine synthase family protein [Prolixibacteraceae bacterium]
MKRIEFSPRPNWQNTIEQQGFLFNDEGNYWKENAAYSFSEQEILQIEKATGEIFSMCCEAVDYVIKREWYDRFFIDKKYGELIRWSWQEDQPSLYGRMDLSVNKDRISLLEFNADTPTSLLESAVIQWYWMKDVKPMADQFNSIHEKMLEHFKVIRRWRKSNLMHFCCQEGSMEDLMTVKYMEDVAQQADLDTRFLYMNELSFDTRQNCFTDNLFEPIETIFKLYPYEWMLAEEFGPELIATREQCWWIEPAWKMLLSNKMILCVLHELFPRSPYILPCKTTKPHSGDYVQKPIYSREGANVDIWINGRSVEKTGGEYGSEGFVYQQYAPLPDFNGNYPVVGSWVIGGEAAGMGIRESDGLITGNTSRFVPHYFE